jgi:hypothetical protein
MIIGDTVPGVASFCVGNGLGGVWEREGCFELGHGSFIYNSLFARHLTT